MVPLSTRAPTGFGIRLAARLVDAVLAWIIGLLNVAIQIEFRSAHLPGLLLGLVGLALAFGPLLADAFFAWTPAKSSLGLRVERANGDPLRPARALLRWGLYVAVVLVNLVAAALVVFLVRGERPVTAPTASFLWECWSAPRLAQQW